MQMPEGIGGFLVDSIDECARRVAELLGDDDRRHELGRAGREYVRAHFLLPRLLADELQLYHDVLDDRRRSSPRAS
jgi:trehalose synthase